MTLATTARRTLATKVIAAATTYAFVILLARLMTPQDFGQVAFFLNLAFLLSVVGAMGQQMAQLRFVPELRATQRGADLPAFVTATFKLAILGAIAAAGLGILTLQLLVWFGFSLGFHPWVVGLGLALIPVVG